MTMASAQDARYAMYDVVAAALKAYPGLHIVYEGNAQEGPPAPDVPFVRVTVQHSSGGQRAVSPALRVGNRRKYTNDGTLFVQCFGAPANEQGQADATAMAETVVAALRRARVGIIFRSAGLRDVGKDNNWYNVNARAFFEYDTLG